MKIVFVLEDLGYGGVQRHTIDLAQALPPTMTAHLCVIGPVAEGTAERLGGLGFSALGHRALRPQAWRALGVALRELEPDVVVSLNQVATLAVTAARAMRLVRAPHVVALHSTTITNLAGWIRTAPFVPAVRFADALIFISANQQAFWTRWGLSARRNVLVRNGIRAERFPRPAGRMRAEQRQALGYEPDDFVIGLTAMFRWEKNHNQLLDAVLRLRQQGVPAKALLVGDGPTRGAVTAHAEALGLTDHVRFTGQAADVKPYLAAMDVGVLCSTAVETLSLAALEAMASGVPMVMSDVGGASEVVVNGESGYLFPAGDTEALTDRLARCAEPDHRALLADAAYIRATTQFSYEAMVDGYAGLFESLHFRAQPPATEHHG